jgi:hypothetical protein
MIKGETSTGKKLSDKLWQSMALLNLSIEAALGSNTDKESDAARFVELLDTNNIIRGIHNSIPKEDEKTVGAIKKTGKSNNPYSYYRDLVKYLGDDSLNMRKYVASVVVPSSLASVSAARFAAFERAAAAPIFDDIKERISKDLPDVVILEYLQDNYTTVKRESFSVKTSGGREIEYALDSAIVRNNKKHHFCAVLTCNGEEYGYDGVSFAKLSPFKWRKNLNKNKNWTFEGSTSGRQRMLWNFEKGYSLLFYYRVTK